MGGDGAGGAGGGGAGAGGEIGGTREDGKEKLESPR